MSVTPAASGRPRAPGLSVSYEFFPPKTPEMEASLWHSVARLGPLGPDFVSVTYGAGGSTRERTHGIVARLVSETPLTPAAHLTCVNASREEVEEVVYGYWDAGVRHIVALRGDPPDGVGAHYVAHPRGFQSTAELVAAIKRIGPFEVSVSAYPEKHPESPDWEADLDVLAAKVDAGADRAITQFFFENADFYRYRERLARRGIAVPLVPGILPISNFKTAARFSASCGAKVPGWLARQFDGLDEDAETRRLVAASIVAEQILDLQANGVDRFHFYTLNRAELVYAACHMLGMRPRHTRKAA
jgi:methylenetetrahydrofolate reductase (NADPH)